VAGRSRTIQRLTGIAPSGAFRRRRSAPGRNSTDPSADQFDDGSDTERQSNPDGEGEQRILDERGAAQKADPRHVGGPRQSRDRRSGAEPGQRQPSRSAGSVHRHPAARQEPGGHDQQTGAAVELPARGADRLADVLGTADQPGAEDGAAQAVREVVAGEDAEGRGHDDHPEVRRAGVGEDPGRQDRRLGRDHRQHAVQTAQAGQQRVEQRRRHQRADHRQQIQHHGCSMGRGHRRARQSTVLSRVIVG
jgi:hypothetical protein